MTRYFLGVDVGGTKTHALVADEGGQVVGFGQSGPGNPDGVGHDGLYEVLQAASQEAFDMAGIRKEQVAGAGFGIGGFDWPSQRPLMLNTIGRLGLNAPVEPANDAIIGLLAGSQEGWGVAVVAGTGCNCWGLDRQRRTGQVTGLGLLMGEASGASELVTTAVAAISRDWAQRGPRTALTQAFMELVGASSPLDLLEGLGMRRYRISASAAPLIFQVAESGDPVAVELIHWSGRELGSLAVGVIHQLGFEDLPFEVVMVGSFWKGSPVVAQTMLETIHEVAPGARLVRLNVPPVVGGVLLGMEKGGLQPASVHEQLVSSTIEVLGL